MPAGEGGGGGVGVDVISSFWGRLSPGDIMCVEEEGGGGGGGGGGGEEEEEEEGCRLFLMMSLDIKIKLSKCAYGERRGVVCIPASYDVIGCILRQSCAQDLRQSQVKARPLTLVVRVERGRSFFLSSCFLFQERVVASPLDLLFLVTW